MYLVSLYFDEKTEKNLQRLIDYVEAETGNKFMTDGRIIPHITLLEFDTSDENRVIDIMDSLHKEIMCGGLFFATIGVFKKQSVYVQPVLNMYLQELSEKLYGSYSSITDVKFNPYYKPYGWIPHVSVGKHLDGETIKSGFLEMLKHFTPFEGRTDRIGIAKTNPHRDIKVYKL